MLLLKTLHVAAAVLWLGNFAVTGVWALRAFISRNIELARFAAREILFTDAVFTLLFGSAVVISGLVLAQQEHIPVLRAAWTRDALAVVVGSGVLWLVALLPLEITLLRRTRAGASTRLLFACWNVLGWLLAAALFAVIYLMIAKPV